ncbi:hypothetical protein K8B83_11950 [Shewanella inventionis]|uniref:hypothetical protein n=1 Tax=Shewanella inventionis TaxID=1738770 RepID=UPI001CC052CF|nr:hypothetical protein [Shewanella inventionis]UAL41620.1 hypothetical protein K8B83_11950 [Shewanella inventionis]
MTFENMDVFAERPGMGLPRVIEVISLSIVTHCKISRHSNSCSKAQSKITPRSRLKGIAGMTPYLVCAGWNLAILL